MNEQPTAKKTIEYLKIATTIFLTILIAILIYQFYTADKIAKDIALTTDPTALIKEYENLTGNTCLCSRNLYEKLNNKDLPVNKIEIVNKSLMDSLLS